MWCRVVGRGIRMGAGVEGVGQSGMDGEGCVDCDGL